MIIANKGSRLTTMNKLKLLTFQQSENKKENVTGH